MTLYLNAVFYTDMQNPTKSHYGPISGWSHKAFCEIYLLTAQEVWRKTKQFEGKRVQYEGKLQQCVTIEIPQQYE